LDPLAEGLPVLAPAYQIDEGRKRLLWIGRERQVKTLLGFFRWLGPERSARLRFICSDMWKPYLRVIAKKAGQAIHVLALDEVRAQEARALKASGYQPILTRTRWLLLKRRENLTEQQRVRLADLLRYTLYSPPGPLRWASPRRSRGPHAEASRREGRQCRRDIEFLRHHAEKRRECTPSTPSLKRPRGC
jgi:hypothetical protein